MVLSCPFFVSSIDGRNHLYGFGSNRFGYRCSRKQARASKNDWFSVYSVDFWSLNGSQQASTQFRMRSSILFGFQRHGERHGEAQFNFTHPHVDRWHICWYIVRVFHPSYFRPHRIYNVEPDYRAWILCINRQMLFIIILLCGYSGYGIIHCGPFRVHSCYEACALDDLFIP